MSSLKYTGLGFFVMFLLLLGTTRQGQGQVTVGFTYEQYCDSLVFTDASIVSGETEITDWEWNFGDGNSDNGQNVFHVYSGQGPYTVHLTVTFTNPAGQDDYSEVIEIWKVNSADITADPAVCNGLEINFEGSANTNSGAVIPPDSLKWDFESDDIFDAFGSPVSNIYPAPGTYSVRFIAINNKNCSDEATHVVEVLEGPEAAFDAEPVCLGDPTNFINESVAPAGAMINEYYWDFDLDGTWDEFVESPSFTFASAGTFDVKLKIITDQGCADSIINSVTINDLPIADFTFDSQCPEIAIQFTDQSVANASGEMTYFWDFGDFTSTDQNPQHTFLGNGLFNVSLQVTNSNGCVHDTVKEILIEKPVANFDFDDVCFGETTYFTDQSTYTASPISIYSWDFGDGVGTSTLQNPDYTFTNHGLYNVTLQIENELGCIDDSIIPVLVDTLPVANFSFGPSCSGMETCFTDESTPNADTLISWTWNFGDGNISTLKNPCHIFSDTGYYTISLVVVNIDGCVSEVYEEEIYVAGQPQANFEAVVSCLGDTTHFINLTDSVGTEITSWLWDFDDPASMGNNTSVLFEPSHFFPSPGMYDVSLSVENNFGCQDMQVQTITIDSLPEALFTKPDTIAYDVEFMINENSIGHGSPVVTRSWDFGDGTTATNINPVMHTYASPGKYEICLTVEDYNGCTDQFCDTIVVSEHPEAGFTYASDVTLETFFFDESQPSSTIVDWYWDFGDPTTSLDTAAGVAQPMWTYATEGWYNVYLKVWDRYGGTDEITQMVYAGNAVIADFEHRYVCLGDTTIFVDNSYSPISAGFETWYWDFGDGHDSTYNEPQDTLYHRFMFPGVYEVKFGVSATVYGYFMTDTMFQTVEVFEHPFARIDTAGIGVCFGEEIQFNDASIYVANDPGAQWNWDFRDGWLDTLQNPLHTYQDTGEFYVILEIMTEHGCVGTDSSIAYVSFAPDFDFLIKNPCLNNPATFIPDYDSTKLEITDWNWNFGDNLSNDNTSTISHPQHTYTRIDNYTITMKVSSHGCENESQKDVLVYPVPYSNFNLTPDYGGVQGRVKFQNNSIFASHYLWDFGNGNTSTVPDPVEVYEYDSTYTVTLISYNDYPPNTTDDFKCSDTTIHELKIFFKGLYFPTAFSPNNPNTEISRFTPKGVNLEEFEVKVFDMRGNLMWETDKLDEYGTPIESWDGYANGVLMPQGMYIWKASATFKDGTTWQGQAFDENVQPQTNGVVTLIK
ncbi:MAG: PKD domain-containing protein [Bacteroidetes bacterium]|nr:PKD domain-containing protein [Bacteroidota bacterium]